MKKITKIILTTLTVFAITAFTVGFTVGKNISQKQWKFICSEALELENPDDITLIKFGKGYIDIYMDSVTKKVSTTDRSIFEVLSSKQVVNLKDKTGFDTINVH